MIFRNLLTAVAVSSFALIGGCSSPVDEVQDESVGVDGEEISAAAQRLVGAYIDDSGKFRSLVFSVNNNKQTFFGNVATGIDCITTPCPTTVRIEGKWSVRGSLLTLTPASSTADLSNYGTFRFTLQGSKLSLYKGMRFINSLGKVSTYCDTANDCSTQSYIHPMCVGYATCSTENTCGWQCGVEPVKCEDRKSSASCAEDPNCQEIQKPYPCPPGRMCPAVMVFDRCASVCEGLDEASCSADARCAPSYKPFPCAPGRICPAVMVFDTCKAQ